MKKKLAIVLMIAVLTVLAAGCGQAGGSHLSSVDVQLQEETRALDGGRMVELSYPVVSGSEADEAATAVIEQLNEHFRQSAEAFVQQAAAITDAEAGTVFTYATDVRYNENGKLSVVEIENLGNQQYYQYAATYSLADGEKMTLGDLLDMKQSKAEETVVQQFGGVIQSDPATFHADAADYVKEHLDLLQYYRTSEGLTIFFQAGEIAPASVGVIEIVIQ